MRKKTITRRKSTTQRKRRGNKSRRTTGTRRSRVIRGGTSVSFPASFSNNDIAVSPQSYLPYNNFANDPGYNTVSATNTGPFLTGMARGGRKMRGGNAVTSNVVSGINYVTNGVGIVSSPAVNELSGVAGIMSGFSNTGAAYNSEPAAGVPLA